MSPDGIAVAILNWNGTSFLEQFLPSVFAFSQGASIYVIDNGSDDQPEKLLAERFPEIRWLHLGKNYGFCGGYNRAIPQLKEEYVVLLNSDVEVSQGWLEPLAHALNQDPLLAAVQPNILSHHQPQLFEYAGAAGGYIDHMGYPFCRGRMFDTLEQHVGQYDSAEPFPVFWASGACMMIRRKAFLEAGGFDEEFFAHMEEIDLCWRLQHQGLKLAVVTQSKVYHVGGGTLPVDSPHKRFLNYRNNLLMLYKNLPEHKVWPVLLTRLLLDGIAGALDLLKGKPELTWAIIRSHVAFYKLKSKYEPLARDKFYPATLYPGSVVWAYFVKKKKYFSALDWSPVPNS
jgi:GT2 family glycosyltransferase